MIPLDVCGLSLILNINQEIHRVNHQYYMPKKSGMYQVIKHDERWKKIR